MIKTFRSGLTLTELQIKEIDHILTELGNRIPARYILLIESTGQFVAEWGDRRGCDPVSLGALMAGDVLATLEMARMTGEDDNYQMILREGQDENAFLAQSGELILLALSARSVPIGWARLLIYYTSDHLAQVVTTQEEELFPELDFSDENLGELFGAELDDLWLGGDD